MPNLESAPNYLNERPRIAGIVNGIVQAQSPAEYLAANARTNGTMTVTVGGTVADGDLATITVSHGLLAGGSKAFQITGASDTTATAANKLAALLNASTDLRALGVYATVVGAIVTLVWPGPLASAATITVAVTGTTTLTRSGSGKFSGGAGPIIPTDNYRCTYKGVTILLKAGFPDIVASDLLATMVTEGAPIY